MLNGAHKEAELKKSIDELISEIHLKHDLAEFQKKY